MLTEYRLYKPTSFDGSGSFLPDRQNWLVLPVGQNRDSDVLSKCNFEVALETMGGESDTVEVHRFGHWACGWFEIILVDPSRLSECAEIDKRLENYPVLDEDRFSEMEYNAACDAWMDCGMRYRIEVCDKFNVSIFAARRDEIPERVEISYLAE